MLNSFADSAKYNGHYGGGHTERGRGDNALTDNTFVDKGLSKIKGIDYLSDLHIASMLVEKKKLVGRF